MPVDMVTYTSLLTLIVFLILQIPGIWQQVDFNQLSPIQRAGMSGGVAAISGGAIALTIQSWMEPTHTINRINYADVWHIQLQLFGWALVGIGLARLVWNTGMLALKIRSAETGPVLE